MNLHTNWQLCQTPANAYADSAALLAAANGLTWMSAPVPGTVAQALQGAGQYSADNPTPLHDFDFWYRCPLPVLQGQFMLCFDGLATLAHVYVDDVCVGQSTSMYQPLRMVIALAGAQHVYVVCKSLHHHLQTMKPPRAHWKVAMVPHQALRAVRTTLLGHMPSWCPDIHTIGPWLGVQLTPLDSWPAVHDVSFNATVSGHQAGCVAVSLKGLAHQGLLHGQTATVACAGVVAPLAMDGDDHWVAQLHVPHVQHWWPCGMGEQTLYDVELRMGDQVQVLGQVGFRQLTVNAGPDGQSFALNINGQALFARGAVWVPPDMLHVGGQAGVLQRLQQLVDMGANMLRVAGTFCYESTEFYRHCDRLGLLVWQDVMLANFDYPWAQDAFAQQVTTEVASFLRRTASSPSLAVVCGGSEVFQQASMLGVPPDRCRFDFFTHQLPALCQQWAPHVVSVPNSPFGGDVPFGVRQGVSHYFGVGAYERALDDAQLAKPCFMTECLAFAQVPEPISLDEWGVPAVHHPKWKAGVPRDRWATWDFEDTRDHYLERVFGVQPALLRRSHVAHYLAASRALMAHIMSTTLARWRSPASATHGALVFTAGDLQAGAGWGLMDVWGEPKSAYYGFQQVAQPLALLLTDQGCDGLDVHVVNDTPQAWTGCLAVQLLRQGKVPIAKGQIHIEVPAYAGRTWSATQVLGAFYDVTYAYRFGAPGHDTVVASLQPLQPQKVQDVPQEPVPLLQACYFPLGIYAQPTELGIKATLTSAEGQWWLLIESVTTARFVHIDDRTHRAQEQYFHLPAGVQKRVRLMPRGDQSVLPQGVVTALNGVDSAHYSAYESAHCAAHSSGRAHPC